MFEPFEKDDGDDEFSSNYKPLSVSDAAYMLNVTQKTVRRRMRAGRYHFRQSIDGKNIIVWIPVLEIKMKEDKK